MQKARSFGVVARAAVVCLFMALVDVQAMRKDDKGKDAESFPLSWLSGFKHTGSIAHGEAVTSKMHDSTVQVEEVANPYVGNYFFLPGPNTPGGPVAITCDNKAQLFGYELPLVMEDAKKKCADEFPDLTEAVMYTNMAGYMGCFFEDGDNLHWMQKRPFEGEGGAIDLLRVAPGACGGGDRDGGGPDASRYAGDYGEDLAILCNGAVMYSWYWDPAPVQTVGAKKICEALKLADDAVMYWAGPIGIQQPIHSCFTADGDGLSLSRLIQGGDVEHSVYKLTKRLPCPECRKRCYQNKKAPWDRKCKWSMCSACVECRNPWEPEPM